MGKEAADTPNTTVKPAGGGYEVSHPHGRCAVCGRVIEPDQKLMAALRENPQGFERLDICQNCWPQFDRGNVLAFWQTVMPHTQVKRKVFVDDEVLCGLFERLADVSEPAKQQFRFVLGLILMRKKLLVYESSRKEQAGEIWSLRFKGKEELLDLLNPQLTEQQMHEVSAQLGEILNEEL